MSARVEFRLTMPCNNAWDGRWSGEGRDYLLYTQLSAAALDALMQGERELSWSHSFGDGWVAQVTARVMNPGEKRKKSAGFCGYDWMVSNILAHRSTRAPAEAR